MYLGEGRIMSVCRKLIPLTLLFLSFAVPAYAGSGISGGANGVKGKGVLVSHYANEGSKPIRNEDFSNLRGFSIAEEVFRNIGKTVPDFLPVIQAVFKKDWYMEPKTLQDCPDDGSLFKVETVVVACQDAREVRVNEHWFEKEAKDDRARATMFVHEGLRENFLRALKTQNPIVAGDVHYMDRFLFREPFPAEDLLSSKLREFGFGGYSTASQVRDKEEERRGQREFDASINEIDSRCEGLEKSSLRGCLKEQHDFLSMLQVNPPGPSADNKTEQRLKITAALFKLSNRMLGLDLQSQFKGGS